MAVARQMISVREYLELERASDIRHEYHAGQIYAMSGGSHDHSLIATNVIGALHNLLMEGPCEVHGSDLRIKVESTGLYTYADAVILCGGPEFEDPERDSLLNPVIIFEVLSDSTEKYDRGLKFEHYRKIPTLKEYV